MVLVRRELFALVKMMRVRKFNQHTVLHVEKANINFVVYRNEIKFEGGKVVWQHCPKMQIRGWRHLKINLSLPSILGRAVM